MGADYSKRCERVDARFHRAKALIEMWVNGNREYVLGELSFAEGRLSGKASTRMLAAIGWVAVTTPHGEWRTATQELLETIARELDRP